MLHASFSSYRRAEAMDEERVNRLCGLVARLRQQHAALGLTLDEIEACLADAPPDAPTPDHPREPAERAQELPRSFSPAPEPDAG
jgi:hypothetical protein